MIGLLRWLWWGGSGASTSVPVEPHAVIAIAAESRSVAVEADIRSCAVSAEDRTISVESE
jgi:hypothetical protein